MKNSILTIVLLFFSAVLNAAESSYFTLDTRSESFAICDLESKVCNGAYGSHGGKTAYLFQRWAGGGDLEFKAIPKSEKEIVKYEFFINGQSQGAPSSNNKFRLPLSFRYQGDKLTVVGYDKFGTPTKEFRANFEVVPRPPILEGDEVSNASLLATPRIEDNKLIYDFGEYTLRNISLFSFSGKNPKKGFFPTVSGDKKVESKVGGEFKIEASYDSDGNTRAGFAVGGYRSEEKLRQSRNAENKQFAKGWGSMLGADVSVGATLKGEWGWQPDIREYELNSFSGLLYYDFSVKSPTLRPPWFPALYFNATLGAEGGIGAKKSYMPLMCSANIWDNIRWSGTMTPYVTLTGGVGNDKIHLEASGTGRLPIELDGRDFSAAVEGDFKFNIRCTVFWGLIDYDKDFVLLSGRRQIYPESRHSLSAFSQGEIVFRPFLDFHDSHIYHNPMLSKGNGGVAILATDVPLQPISDVVCQGNGLYWLQLNDDTTRGGINVSKLMLYSQSSNGNVQAESVWDDGRNDFGPQLQITSTGNFVAMWTKANRAWSDDESFTNALKSLNVVAAIRNGENGMWVTNVVSSCGAYNHNISMATAGENLFACWVRNRDGLLFADSSSQDQIVAAMSVNGNWNTEEVIRPNAERVGTITTDYVNGIPTCIWDEDESYDEEAVEEGVKKRLVMAQWTGGAWTISLLKADNHSNENPILTHDSTGSSVLIWSCDGAIVYSYDMGVTCAQMWSGNGSAPSRMIAIRDTSNNLKGIATLASSPGMEQKSQEILYSEYVGGSQTNSWRPIVPLTDNDVIEQYFRGVHDEANGKIKIIYQEDPFQSAVATNRYGTLKRIDYTVGIDMALCDNIQFDDDPVVGSNSIARVIIENRGLLVPSPTTNYFVRLYRGDMRLGEVSITNFPAQGERLEVDIPWNISLSQTPTNFIVRLDEDCVLSDINRANNTISSAILDAELYIDSVDVRYAGGNERIISATIGNSGFAYSREGTNVEFRIGSESGGLIGSDALPSLSAGETMRYVASIRVDISTLNLTSEYTKVYAVIGDQARAGQIVKLDDADGDGLSNVEEGGIGSNPYSVDTDGDGISDFDEVRTYGSSPTNFSYRITFDAGSNGLMRDGTASALLVADTGVAPRPATVTPKSGYRFVGWEETLTPATGEMTYHAKYEEITYYVNAVTGCDTNSGETAAAAWKTLQYAVNNTPDDRRVYVADGVYEPFTCANRSIVIESVNGPRYTIIDGGGTNRCATLGTSTGQTNTVLRGFTLRNGDATKVAAALAPFGGGVCGGTVESCLIYNNTGMSWPGGGEQGGGAYASVLNGCTLTGNWTVHSEGDVFADSLYFWRFDKDINGDGKVQNQEVRDVRYWGGTNMNAYAGSVTATSARGPYGGPLWTNMNVYLPGRGMTIQSPCMYFPVVTNVSVNVNNESIYSAWSTSFNLSRPAKAGSSTVVARIRPQLHYGALPGASAYFYNNGMAWGDWSGYEVGLGPKRDDVSGTNFVPVICIAHTTYRFYNLAMTANEWYDIAFVITDSGKDDDGNDFPDIATAVVFSKKYGLQAQSLNISTNAYTTYKTYAPTRLGAESSGTAMADYYNATTAAQIASGNAVKCFNGQIHQVAVWDRALTVDEVAEAFGHPNNMVMGVGTENGASSEFGTIDEGSHDWTVGEAWHEMAGSVDTAHRKLTLRFSPEANSLSLAHSLHVKVAEAGSAGQTALLGMAVNGKHVPAREVFSGENVWYFIPTNILVAGENLLTLSYEGGEAQSIAFDKIEMGGSWQLGKNDRSHREFSQEGNGLSSDFYVGNRNLLNVARGITTRVRDIYLHFQLRDELATRRGFTFTGGMLGPVWPATNNHFRVLLNGVEKYASPVAGLPDFSTVTFDVAEGELLPGWNTVQTQFTGTNRWVTYDYMRLAMHELPSDAVTRWFNVYHVSPTGLDSADGHTEVTAFKTIQQAVDMAEDGDEIVVADGTYQPFSSSNKRIVIKSANGPRYTVIDGGGTNRCVTLGTSAGQTNTVLRGFTLRNGNANGSAVTRNYGGGVCCGTVEDCVLANNEARWGGGAYNSSLLKCAIVGNRGGTAEQYGYGGGIYWSSSGLMADSCYVADNTAYRGSAIWTDLGVSGNVRDSLIVNNTALLYATAENYSGCVVGYDDCFLVFERCTVSDNNCAPSYYPGTLNNIVAVDSIIHCNYMRNDFSSFAGNAGYGAYTNCCTTLLGSTDTTDGIVTDEPSFVDHHGRIYDLLSASGENIVGVGNVVDTNGMFKVGLVIDGYGVVTRPGAVVSPGESLEFTAEETGRAFEGFYTNGVFATPERTIELNDIRSDIRVTARFAKRTAYVAFNGNDANDGLTAATPKQTINAALPLVENGEAIEVVPGTYAPIAPTGYASKGKSIRIYSTHGALQTIIDGGGATRCANLSDYYGGTTNVVLEGFTLTNGCSADAGGGAYYGMLVDCVIVGNVAETYGGGSFYSHLINCVVTRNKAGTSGGGTYYGVVDHCTVCGNEAGFSGGGTYYGTIYSSIVSANVVGGNAANWYNGTFDSCCTHPNRGNNPITGDPLLVDGWNGDARLRVGSPCIVDGVQICGAYVGEPVEGVSVSVGVQGAGAVSNETILVTSGGTATIEAVETVRPFLYWNINGEQIEDRVYALTNVTADVRAIAVFGTFDWYVDAEYGDDANDGSDWDSAKRTLQSAIDAAVDDEIIYVEAGMYEPISTDNKRIRLESMNGAEMTFIDGGGTNRCATLGTTSVHTNSAVVGFTLLNGYSSSGGGSYCGTLAYCVISNCVALGSGYVYGGGSYYGNLNNCLIAYNCATSTTYAVYGGGASCSVLRNCTVARNCAKAPSYVYGGGTYGSYSAFNSIIWGNTAQASAVYGENARYTYLYYCCTDATADYRYSGTITNDPQFVDADAGDFHLKVGSPCLNAGYNSYVQGDMDLDWDDRIQGTRVDMGCYEGAEYAAPPGQVTGLVAVRGVLRWDAMPDAEGFMVYRSTRRAASSAKYIGMSDTNTYTDETAVEGTTYYYWVTAFNTLGMGTRSDVAENSWPILLAITTSELPDATEMVEYSAQLEATGGTAPYSWEVGMYDYVVSREASSFRDDSGAAQGWNAVDNAWQCNLPFAFPFYGKAYTNLYVSSNGTISFGKEVHSWSYSESTFKATPMISVLWNDLTTSGSGFDVFVEANGTCATIRWRGAYYSGGQAVNFSATLYETGDIRLAYGAGNAKGGYIGVSAGDGQQRQLVGSSGASWANARDVVFSTGAFVPSAAVLPFGVSFSSSGLLHGTPTEAGTANLVFRVTDSAGGHDIRELPFTVAANPNERPVIESVTPTNAVTFVKVGDSQTFSVVASDPEGNPLSYRWTVDGENVEGADAECYTYRPSADDAGNVRVLTCFVSDDLWVDKVLTNWTVKVPRTIYVDVATTNEEWAVAGSSPELAYPSLSRALDYAEIGDTILVAPGVYSNDGQYDDGYLYFRSYGIGYGESGAVITVKSMAGAERTTIKGAVYNDDHNHWQREDWVRYYYGGYYGGYYEQSPALPVLEGFTLCCSAVQGVSLVNCSVKGGDDGAETSGLSGCRLSNCTVTGCSSSYELLYSCELTRCTVAGNTVPDGCFAVDEGSLVIDSIVHGNMTAAGVAANYNPSIYQGYAWEETEDGYREWTVDVPCVVFTNSCACPLPTMAGSDGNIADDPRLVDAANGDLRLRVGSPCIVDGIQTMGAWLGGPVAGAVVAVRVEGHGAVSPMTAVVSDGRDVTFDISDFTRQFLGFYTNGVFATSAASLVWRNISEDGIVTAVFSNYTFHVDAAAGSDSNDGLSWASAKASIQAAVGEALDGEAVYVKPGTYGPINSNGKRIRIESVDGKAATIIDGGGTNRCATLGWTTNTLVRGFTLTNGKASYGGAAYYGTLEDCDVVGNVATSEGGGLCNSSAIRCRIVNNAVQGTSWYAEGGGAYYGILRNCLVAGNSACSSERVDGGGTYYGTCYNCTIVSNSVFGATRCDGGGAYGGSLYNTIVYGNTATNVPDEVTSISRAFSSRVGADPLFADAANGDYRLAADSPCIDAGGNNYVMDDVDLDGNARVQHYTVDIGCYEYALATPERDAEADFAAQMAGMCYGVFVGVSQYTYTSSLVGPTVDATNMQTRCVDKGYWHGSNTVAFLDAMATKSAVRARLTSLAAKAVLGDTVLYYQSSHGGSHASGGNYTKDTYICLHDATYEDYEMASDLMQFAAGVKVVVVLDTCHSAGMFKAMGAAQNPASTSGMSFARRVHELVAERAALRKGAKSGITADDIGWIAAADYNQYSWDSARGGAFTVAMLDGWKSGAADYDGDKRLNFHELWRYAKGIATGYSGEDATDAQCLNEEVLLSRFAGEPDPSADNDATKTSPVPVKYVWLDSYPTVLAAFGGDYEAMANAQSPGASGNGKAWPNGSPCYVWQDYVAGTSPTNDTVFTATIRMEGNTPVVTWEPDTPELRATRVYRTLGKKTLLEANWTDVTDKDKSEYNFFMVTIDMP